MPAQILTTEDTVEAWLKASQATRDAVGGAHLVFTNGVFDLYHAGHTLTLDTAKAFGAPWCQVVVGINSDASVRALKGPDRPIIGEIDRMLIVASHWAVDAVCLIHDETPLKLIKQIRPTILVKGGDYSVQNRPIVGEEFVKSYGGRVEFTPSYDKHRSSTSSIITRIAGDAGKKLNGISEIYRYAFEHTESFEGSDMVGPDLAYLFGQIAGGGKCEWSDLRPVIKMLRHCCPPDHWVWSYVDVKEI